MPELTWLGKDAIRHHHQQVPYRPLHLQYAYPAVPALPASAGPAHRLLHGDNLDALKSLLPEFEGRVKCIYIDPPYNTGNEGWAYNDNVSDPALLAWLGQVVGPEGDDLSRHDKWLCMMYPRLKLLHRLLSPDGIIFINLDDNEVFNCKLVLDEIFGLSNFLANIAWEKRFTRSNNAKLFSSVKDNLLVYRKSAAVSILREARSEKADSTYTNPDNDPRGVWTSVSYVNPATKKQRPNLSYPLYNPIKQVEVEHATHAWKYSRETYEEHVKDNKLYWGSAGENTYPRIKKFLTEMDGMVPVDIWKHSESGTTDEASKMLEQIFGVKAAFDTPKPVRLIERVLELATDPDSIILDSFAGSGTTGHAVLKLNARDGGRRQCLLIEREAYAETLTAERLRRVMAGYGAVAGTGGAFGFYTLGEPLLDAATGQLAAGLPWAVLAPYVWRAETNTALPPGALPPRLGQDASGPTYYLHYDPAQDTTLDRAWLAAHRVAAPAVVYADACLLDAPALAALGVVFRKIPRDLRRL